MSYGLHRGVESNQIRFDDITPPTKHFRYRILTVADEDALRQLGKMTLEALRYEVLCAESGFELRVPKVLVLWRLPLLWLLKNRKFKWSTDEGEFRENTRLRFVAFRHSVSFGPEWP